MSFFLYAACTSPLTTVAGDMQDTKPVILNIALLMAFVTGCVALVILYFSSIEPDLALLIYGKKGSYELDMLWMAVRSLVFFILATSIFFEKGFFRYIFATLCAFDAGFSYLTSPFPSLLVPYILLCSGILALLFLPASQRFFAKREGVSQN